SAKIIVGGPYVFTQYRAQEKMVLEYLLGGMKGVDFFIISSQGEGALANVIDALKNDLPLDTIHNLYYKTPEGFRFTPITQESNPMGEHMVDWGLFADGIGEHVNIRTSISCPFACAFCSFPDNAGQFQTASVADVERELDSLAALGTVKSIQFIDDTFNMPVKRAKNIMRMMIKNKYEFKWHCHLRCQYMDEESAQLMQESGCQGVFLGIETGSQSMLVNMNKRAKQPQYLKGMELLHKYGISTLGSFFIGFPGETPQTVRETIDFIEESEMDFYQIQQWYCDTTTPIWKKKDELQIKGSQFEWSHSSMDSKTAADLVEQFFMSIRKSVCVPRYNFDFDHLFHLLSRGMTMDQVKTFLNIFNRGLEEKLISLARHEVRPEIIGSFKEFSRSLHPTVKVGSLSSAAGAAVVG
ncbi:MAG: radical SAM protein, partial [bacterium]|nr:radical SAM protein [bacterium]